MTCVTNDLLFYVQNVVSALDHIENGRYVDAEKHRSQLIQAAEELRDYYRNEIYDGGEE